MYKEKWRKDKTTTAECALIALAPRARAFGVLLVFSGFLLCIPVCIFHRKAIDGSLLSPQSQKNVFSI